MELEKEKKIKRKIMHIILFGVTQTIHFSKLKKKNSKIENRKMLFCLETEVGSSR